jgi:GT2 family glycosyltransferase
MEAASLSSLLQICAKDSSIEARIEILVHDNSPKAQVDQFTPGSERFDYVHDPSNPGLAAAYNRALAKAKNDQIPWLLTLDQDTAMDENFLLQLLAALESDESEKACAYIPELINDGLVLSPQIVGSILYHRIPFGFFGVPARPVVAFNSAACMSVSALMAIGGFPKNYWLDYLDHIVFYRLQAAGGRVYVLNSQLAHSLSLQNIESEVSMDRYNNILQAEWRYVGESSPRFGLMIHRIRLLKRSVVHFFRLKNKNYAIQTLRAAIKRSASE